jgi:hypothetical protein
MCSLIYSYEKRIFKKGTSIKGTSIYDTSIKGTLIGWYICSTYSSQTYPNPAINTRLKKSLIFFFHCLILIRSKLLFCVMKSWADLIALIPTVNE